jgi:hypothetical protein
MAVEGLEALLAEGVDPRLGRFREVRTLVSMYALKYQHHH